MKNIKAYGRFKSNPASPTVMAAIRQFTQERRNAVRGIISTAERRDLLGSEIEAIRANTNADDMALAGAILNGPDGLRSRKVRQLTQADICHLHDLTPKQPVLELAYACGFANAWSEVSREAVGTIKYLAQISHVDPIDAAMTISKAAERWGASVYLAWKISYLKTFFSDFARVQDQLAHIDQMIDHELSPMLQYSALENLKDTISIFAVARRHTNTLAGHVTDDFRRSYILSNLVSTPFSSKDCASYVLRATESSLIDLIHSLWVILNLSDRLPEEATAIKDHLSPDLYSELMRCRDEVAALPLPSMHLSEGPTNEQEDFDDHSLSTYRQSAVFLEFPTMSKFRNDLDRVIGHRLISPLLPQSSAYYGEPLNNKSALRQNNVPVDDLQHNELVGEIDTFYRTYLFLRFIQNPLNLASLDNEDIHFLFDRTIGLEALLLERELKTMHINASDETRALISILALALYRSKSSDPDVDFDFREKLEDYILNNFSGNINEFITSIAPNSPQVANYIVTSLDEVTLQKMYSLVDSAEKSDSVRKDILTAIGFRLNRIEYIVEAEAIETRAKVSKIKSYFDASRMYVDSIAMRRWLSSTPSAYAQHYKELLPKITARLTTGLTIKSADGKGKTFSVLELTPTDQHLVSQVAKEAFWEFCTNNEFGIESYLGRRIRHNTLHGVMTKSVDTVLQRPEYHSVLAGTPFGRAVSSWESWYKIYIERIRKEFLQFKSSAKPNAIFDAEIDPADPATYSNIQQLVQTLRISGPEMLHDLVVSFCWRQIAPQLDSASRRIRVTMAQEVTQALVNALGKFSGPEEQKIKSALIESIGSTFAQVGSWFQIPQTGFVPASISDICHIVDIEHNRASTPTMVICNRPDVKYYGISVHRIYDCLAVLLQNAFKHGERGAPVRVNVESLPINNTNLEALQISVLSQMPDSNRDECVDRVQSALSSTETGKDMVTEGYSGIKKVKFITKLNEGFSTVTHTVVGNEIEVRFTMKAELASENHTSA